MTTITEMENVTLPVTKMALQKETPRRRLFTIEEYYRMAEAGIFGPDERLELLDGEIIQNMTPQLTLHATGIVLSEEALRPLFPGCHVRIQLPLRFSPHNEPEPDIAVVVGKARDYLGAHPTTAVLVVEVSDSTLAQDRARKAAIYAQAGIADYWILNLKERLLEVHRQPEEDTANPGQFRYASVQHLNADASVSPLAAPQAAIHVADLLP